MTKKDMPELSHDAKLWISTGRSRYDKHWKNKELTWSAILARLREPIRTPETYAEYIKAAKHDQDNIKDVGGFVGGTLKDGKRGSHTVLERTILSFDLDFAPTDFYTGYALTADYASACYSTHKHSAKTPRFRLLVPLSRAVTPDEYEAVSRMLATDIGMEFMDPSTFQPSRLMYWPSCSFDSEYFFDYTDAPFLDPDTVLSRYPDWRDASEWPTSDKEAQARKSAADKQADPLAKHGIVGAFCRAHDIVDAIETFLPDIYTTTNKPNRYTYAAGSTTAGLVIYDGGKFAFSNHGTDPAGGQLCNSFDLVRIHKFIDKDSSTSADTPISERPSYKAMVDLAFRDPATLEEYEKDRHTVTADDFDDEDLTPEKIAAKLDHNKSGILKTVRNVKIVFEKDPALQGLALDLMSGEINVLPDRPVPWDRRPGAWTDTDDAQLYAYVSEQYTEFPRAYVMDQKIIKAEANKYHPIKQYLEGLPPWDGVKRVDTLLIDYLGAQDNVFTREATAKMLIAAVRRIYEPGCKFDTMLVLSGPPSTGKSTLIAKLGGSWFSDNLTFEDMKDKSAAEKLQGYWLLEISEMKGMRKMDVESIKAFISRQDDIYRAAYAHNTERHPRQSIIFGTVNDLSGYLKDVTGNRRFWPITVTGEGKAPEYRAWNITEEIRGQIWAEVLARYKAGERSLILSAPAEKIAVREQTDALEQDDREGIVEDFLDMQLPDGWEEWDTDKRLDYLGGDVGDDLGLGLTHEREEVTNLEIWCECFKEPMKKIQKKDSYEIAGILKRLGWERSGGRKRVPPYGLQRVYRRPRKV